MSINGFNKVNLDQWQDAAETALGGQSIDVLSRHNYDGITINPLYYGSQNSNQTALPQAAWHIIQAVNHPKIATAKTHIAEDLEQGVNGLSLYSNQSLNALGFGIDINADNIKSLFKNTYLEMISLRLETGLDEFSTASTLLTHYRSVPREAKLCLGIDPIGKLAQYGGWNGEAITKQAVQNALNKFSATHILRVDGRIAHNAGASEVQELSFIISTALSYLKWADEARIDLNIAAAKIEICISADQNQFMTMAKMRALRQLWAELLDGLEITQMAAHIYAETSFRMVTKSDPWVNLLRATVACFSAGIGGANQVGILPLSAAIGLPTSFDRRLARHMQTILIEESHLADVTDPAAGSAYVENLTTELTIKAWEAFQNTQRTGGLIANLLAGNIQRQIAQTAAKRQQDFADNQQCLVGTSEFTNPDEPEYQTLEVEKSTPNKPTFQTKIEALTPQRDAKMFENKSEAL